MNEFWDTLVSFETSLHKYPKILLKYDHPYFYSRNSKSNILLASLEIPFWSASVIKKILTNGYQNSYCK